MTLVFQSWHDAHKQAYMFDLTALIESPAHCDKLLIRRQNILKFQDDTVILLLFLAADMEQHPPF